MATAIQGQFKRDSIGILAGFYWGRDTYRPIPRGYFPLYRVPDRYPSVSRRYPLAREDLASLGVEFCASRPEKQ